MATCLINLESFSYQDYQDMDSYIQETFVENTEMNKLLEQFKEVVKVLDTDITKFDKEKTEKLLDDLNKTADKVSSHNKTFFKSVYYISTMIQFIETIISICQFFKFLKGERSAAKERRKNADEIIENLPAEKKEYFRSHKKEFAEYYYQLCKDPKSFIDKAKDGIKNFFTVKTLITKALSMINKFIGGKAATYLSYEQGTDKGYELLLNCEAKLLTEKRKAEKAKEDVSNIDTVIEFIENLKKERVKAKELARRAQNESTILESDRTETKINNFKLVCRDLAEALNIEKANLQKYCDAALYVVNQALKTTDDNKDSKLDLMEKKVKETEDFVKDIDRFYDKQTITTLFRKYSSMFSVNYTSFGNKARDKFEQQLSKLGTDMNNIIDNYYTKLNSLIPSENSKNIEAVLRQLEEKSKCSQSTIMGIKRIIRELDDSSKLTFDTCQDYINWCISNLDNNDILRKLKMKVKKFKLKLFR